MKPSLPQSVVRLTICFIMAVYFVQVHSDTPPPNKVNLKTSGLNSSSVVPKSNTTSTKIRKIVPIVPIVLFVAPVTTPKTCEEGEKLTEDNKCRKIARSQFPQIKNN